MLRCSAPQYQQNVSFDSRSITFTLLVRETAHSTLDPNLVSIADLRITSGLDSGTCVPNFRYGGFLVNAQQEVRAGSRRRFF